MKGFMKNIATSLMLLGMLLIGCSEPPKKLRYPVYTTVVYLVDGKELEVTCTTGTRTGGQLRFYNKNVAPSYVVCEVPENRVLYWKDRK